MAKYRTSEEQDLIDATKQAKLIPGNNVHISDTNEISVDECKIGRSFTTNKSVGNLPINTEISADMTIAEILYKILYGGEVSTINLYYGASDTIPTDLTGLSIIENQSVDVLLADGKLQKIITGHVDASGNHVNQYPVFACDKSAHVATSPLNFMPSAKLSRILLISLEVDFFNSAYVTTSKAIN